MKTLQILLAVIIVVGFSACEKEGNGRVIVRLTDSPGDYEEVNIDILDVEIHRELGEQNSGWESLSSNAGIYNLLDLSGGIETILADIEIPAGEISQIRLLLGSNNTVKIGGDIIPLSTPGAQQSGLKVNINETLLDGVTYSILLDFDAASSVVKINTNNYILKPVIRTITAGRDGAVAGIVLPETENVAIYAMIGQEIVGTSYATENNDTWFIGGLEAGTYSIVFDPGDMSAYNSFTISDVTVNLGEINDIGETTLELK